MAETKKYSDEMLNQADINEIILNNLDIDIYVSDMVTNKILFANKNLEHTDNALAGRICWEALRNTNKRCEFCPIPYLLKNPGKAYQWQLHTDERIFQVHDSIILWTGGRLAHMQYMVDITR